ALQDYAFHTDLYIAVSTPNATGVYVPATGINPSANASLLRQNVPNTSLAFTGTSVTIIGGANTSGANFGGFVRTNPPTDGSTIFSLKFQQVFDASMPIRIDIVSGAGVAPAGASSYLSIESGYMLGM